MKTKISFKIIFLVGILLIFSAASSAISFISIRNIKAKTQTISEDCMNAVNILSDTEIAVERVQKFANSSAALRMEKIEILLTARLLTISPLSARLLTSLFPATPTMLLHLPIQTI